MFQQRVSTSASLLAAMSLLVATLIAQPAHAQTATWTLTVHKTGAGSGTVTSVPAGISCGTDCTETYADSTSVTLTPAPDPGFTSGAWSGCDSVEGNQCTVTMTTDKAVTASFLAANGKIAFIRAAETGVDIFTMNPDGTAQTNVTNNSAQDTQPDWSPDGTKIAFVSEVVLESGLLDGNPEIYVMNADGSNVTQLTDSTETDLRAVERNPVWSPDGTKIAFQTVRDGNHEIYVMNANGSLPSNLTNNAAADATPSWSPSGTQIAFRSFRDGDNEIFRMGADGSLPTNLTNNTVGDYDPDWSPDGTKIAFTSDRDPDTPGFEVEVYSMNADGTSQTRLTTTRGELPSWSPDATKIAFTGLDSKIYVMNANGTSPTNLTNGRDNEPSWGTNSGTSSLSVTKAGSGSGTVTSSPAGINCGTDCTQLYSEGTIVTLSATPDSGSVFGGWTGCDSVSSNQCTVTITSDRTVAATFDPSSPPPPPPQRQLTVSKTGSGAGTVTSSPAGIDCGSDCTQLYSEGTIVTLSATPDLGSVFGGWTGCGSVSGNQCTVTMTSDRTVTAGFVAQRTLTVDRSGDGSGTVTSSPAGIDCGASCSAPFDDAATVTLTATSDPESTFGGWTGCDSTQGNECVVMMGSDKTVTASFDLVPVAHERRVSLFLRRHLVARGRVTVADGFDACRSDVAVRIQRRTPKGWRTIETTTTEAAGRFRTSIRDRTGAYRAVAPRVDLEISLDVCRRAKSARKVHRHN